MNGRADPPPKRTPVRRLRMHRGPRAIFLLVGLQLVVSWAVMRVLAELMQRESLVEGDLNGSLTMPVENLAMEGLTYNE